MKNYFILYFFLFLSIAITSCSKKTTDSKYLRWIGDSEYSSESDSPSFALCHKEENVFQYFHFQNGMEYEGEKITLLNHFFENYKTVKTDQSGWIRVRFIVNCKGETGRFRFIASDAQYKETHFDSKITDQLLKLTRSLEGWKIQKRNEIAQDYYQYLIFKIENGALIEIMP